MGGLSLFLFKYELEKTFKEASLIYVDHVIYEGLGDSQPSGIRGCVKLGSSSTATES